VTICTKNREALFGDVGADSISARMVTNIFKETIERFPGIDSPVFVVMPNHFHAIITISCKHPGQRADIESAPTTLSKVIQSFKRHSTLEYIKLVKSGLAAPFDKHVWQRSFHDHIIRNEQDFLSIWEYIENNPATWNKDCYNELHPHV